MSRCFPFPPPGYENKARTDHVDLITKEKHKEKKHKKEKREKEKRESKEKNEKDRNKDKHKEKKDRKEKHKDNKKDKDRDKDKSRTTEDRRYEEQIDGHHEVNLGESSQMAADVKDSKSTDLGWRLRDEEKSSAIGMAENFICSIQRRTEGMDAAVAVEKERIAGKEMVPNSIRISQRQNDGMGRHPDNFASSLQRSEGMGKATAMEKERVTCNNFVANLNSTEKGRNHGMGRAVDNFIGSMQERVEGTCTATASEKERVANNVASNPVAKMAPNLTIIEQKRNHGMGRAVDNPVVPRRVVGTCTGSAVEKERGKSNNMVSYPIGTEQGSDGMGCPVENLTSIQRTEGVGTAIAIEKARGKGSKMVPNLVGMEKTSDAMGGPMAYKENTIERKEKTREKEADDRKGEKHGDRDRTEKKNRGKDKDRHKEKEKEEKIREKGELKHKKEYDKARDNEKKEMICSSNINHSAPHKGNAKSAGTDGNTKKRKDLEVNGFLHENDERPNKFLKTSSPSQLCLENGRTLEPCLISTPSISYRATNNITVGVPDNKGKGHKINGIAEPRLLSVELRPPVPIGCSEIQVPLKPPHPDSKYLGQIYYIPEMEELPESDEQEWLFSCDSLRPKPMTKFEAEQRTQVWAEALLIESADVMALPYVIPF